MKNSKLTCNDCIAPEDVFDPNNIAQRTVLCKRHPPQVLMLHTQQGVQLISQYPVIQREALACCDILLEEPDDELIN